MPTAYFEAKPRRAVGFNEVAAAIVPDTMPADLIKQMKKAGVQDVITYAEGNDQERIQAMNNIPDTQFSKELDQQYAAAVTSGDMKAAQQMVDEAARKAGYNSGKLYHGTNSFGFTKFDTSRMDDKASIFTTDNRRVAESYSGETTNSDIRNAINVDLWRLEPKQTLEYVQKYLDPEYRNATDKEINAWAESYLKPVRESIKSAEKFIRENDLTAEETSIITAIKDGLEKFTQSQTDDDAYAAGREVGDALFDLMFENEDIKFELMDALGWEAVSEALTNVPQILGVATKDVFFTKDGSLIEWEPYFTQQLVDKFQKGVYELYGKTDNMFVIDAQGANWNRIELPDEVRAFVGSETGKTRDVCAYAKAMGYSGVNIKNVVDNGGAVETGGGAPQNEYIYFDPSSIKSAAAETYDDNGKLIPLSERFNSESDDIRYSKELDDLLDELLLEDWRDIDVSDLDKIASSVEDATPKRKRKIDNAIKGDSFNLNGSKATYTDSRIDEVVDYYSYGPDKSSAYIAYINPKDFIRLTTNMPSEWFKAAKQGDGTPLFNGALGYYRDLDVEKLRSVEQTPFLEIRMDKNGAKVTGHEGRHRMLAMAFAGIDRAPVVLVDRDNRYETGKTVINRLDLRGQDFYEKRGRYKISLADVTPALKTNTEDLKSKFGGEGTIRFSSELESDLRTQTEELKSAVTKLQDQFKITDGKSLKQSDIDALTNSIVKEYESTLTKDQKKLVADNIRKMGNMLLKSTRGREAQNAYQFAIDWAADIAQVIIENATTVANQDEIDTYKKAAAAIRKTKIHFTKEMNNGNIADYNAFRKKYFGRVNLGYSGVEIDDFWNSMQEEFPGLFPDDIVNPSEQLEYLAGITDGLDAITINLYDSDMAEAVQYCANDILARVMDRSVVAVEETAGDKLSKAAGKHTVNKINAEIDDIQLNIDKINQKIEEGRINTEYAQKQLKSLNDQLEVKNSEIEKLRRDNSTQQTILNDLRRNTLSNVRQFKDTMANMKAKQAEEVQALKDHYKEIKENARNRKEESEARTRLLKIARRLNNKKMMASDRAQLDQYIGELDLIAKSLTDDHRIRLENLREAYEKYAKTQGNNFMPDAETEEKLKRLDLKHIKDMTAEEVKELTEVLLNFENELRTKDNAIKSQLAIDFYQAGEKTIKNIRGSEKVSGLDRIMVKTLSPLRAIRRMVNYAEGDPLYITTTELADGQRNAMDFERRANEMFSKWTNDKKFAKSIAGKDANFIEIKGRNTKDYKPITVKITPAMRMSLYLHSLNNDNLAHIVAGGITIPDYELYVKGKYADAYAEGVTIRMSPEEVKKIAAGMTDEEKAFAMKAKEYFNGMSQKEINAVSEQLKGYSLAQVEDYFPINPDQNFTKTEFESVKSDGSIEGMGFLKERTHATNPIYLRDMSDVLNQSIRMTGKYVGLAIPVRNFSRLYDVTLMDARDSVQKALGNQWGITAGKYVDQMMADLQGTSSVEKNKVLNRLKSNYAGAVLSLNASVALKQSASYPAAAAVIGFKPLAKAMSNFDKVDINLVNKYTPLLWYRSQGYSTAELGDMKSQNKQLPKYLNWIQSMDIATTKKLWKAAEYYVQDQNTSLEVGSDEYYKEVANVYNRVIEETQPNYTSMQRPAVLKSQDSLFSALVMFKTQPMQNLNVLYDATKNAIAKNEEVKKNRNAVTEAALKEAKKSMFNAAIANVVQTAVFAAMTMLWSKIRLKDTDDDDDLKQFMDLFASNEAGMVPFGSEAYELISSLFTGDKYYGVEVSSIATVNDALDSLKSAADELRKIADSEKEFDPGKFSEKLEKLVMNTSKLVGIPAENVKNLIKIVIDNVERSAKISVVESSETQLKKSGLWEVATDDQKQRFDEVVAKYETGAYDEEIKNGEAAGLDDQYYLYYRFALEMADKPNKSGNYGTYTQDEYDQAFKLLQWNYDHSTNPFKEKK